VAWERRPTDVRVPQVPCRAQRPAWSRSASPASTGRSPRGDGLPGVSSAVCGSAPPVRNQGPGRSLPGPGAGTAARRRAPLRAW